MSRATKQVSPISHLYFFFSSITFPGFKLIIMHCYIPLMPDEVIMIMDERVNLL